MGSSSARTWVVFFLIFVSNPFFQSVLLCGSVRAIVIGIVKSLVRFTGSYAEDKPKIALDFYILKTGQFMGRFMY